MYFVNEIRFEVLSPCQTTDETNKSLEDVDEVSKKFREILAWHGMKKVLFAKKLVTLTNDDILWWEKNSVNSTNLVESCGRQLAGIKLEGS